MIKFHGARGGQTLLGIGLSRKNCERLLEGKPIHFILGDMPGFPWQGEVLIVGGETEAEIEGVLRINGAIDDNTPRLGFSEAKEQES